MSVVTRLSNTGGDEQSALRLLSESSEWIGSLETLIRERSATKLACNKPNPLKAGMCSFCCENRPERSVRGSREFGVFSGILRRHGEWHSDGSMWREISPPSLDLLWLGKRTESTRPSRSERRGPESTLSHGSDAACLISRGIQRW